MQPSNYYFKRATKTFDKPAHLTFNEQTQLCNEIVRICYIKLSELKLGRIRKVV